LIGSGIFEIAYRGDTDFNPLLLEIESSPEELEFFLGNLSDFGTTKVLFIFMWAVKPCFPFWAVSAF
jgi:hypothetical protein